MKNIVVLITKYCLCALLVASTAAAADPALLGLVPSDTAFLLGINVEQLKTSKFGQLVFAQAQANHKELGALTGLDLVKGIREVLVAVPSGGQTKRGLFLVSGSFEASAFQALAKSAGASESTVQGIQVFTGKETNPVAAALLSGSVIAGGDPASLGAAIARRGQASGLDAALAAKVRTLSADYDIWLTTSAALADLLRDAPKSDFSGALQGDMIKAIQQISLGLKFGPKLLVALDLVTRTEQDATSMADALRMLIGLAAASEDAKQFAPMLKDLELKAEANTVKLALAIPEETVMTALQSAVGARQKQAPKSSEPATQSAPQSTGPTSQPPPGDTNVVTLPPPKPQ